MFVEPPQRSLSRHDQHLGQLGLLSPPMTESKLRVLVVEDDPEISRLLTVGLASAGMECSTAHDGVEALRILAEPKGQPFDLILLDILLPQKTGWELLESLRGAGREVPVIIVSGRDSVEEKIRGLRLGADDYVVKPFRFEELLARIEAVQRRRHSLAPLEVGELKLDLARRRVERSGRPISLSPREFDILLVLVRANGRVIARKELLEEVWDLRFDPGTNVLDVHLGRLRRKLDGLGTQAIDTVRGQGYRLAVESLKSSAT